MREALQKKTTEAPKKSPDVRGLNGTLRSDSVAGQVAVLQRSIGNGAIERLFRSDVLQAKLKIGQPNDIYEQEADRVAEQVMRMPDGVVGSQLSAVSSKGKFGGLQTVDVGQTRDSLRMKPG
jgi:hypothetical protein